MTKEATTILCHNLFELNQNVIALGEQGYRIVAVLPGAGEMVTIVAQKDDLVDLGMVIIDAIKIATGQI